MKISSDVLTSINNPISRTEIAIGLRMGEQSVARAIRRNSDNGPLTKEAALAVIRRLTGKTNSDILVEMPVTATAGTKV